MVLQPYLHVSTPPNPSPPTPRVPQDPDEWIAVLLAFGILGAMAAWLILKPFSDDRLNLASSDPALTPRSPAEDRVASPNRRRDRGSEELSPASPPRSLTDARDALSATPPNSQPQREARAGSGAVGGTRPEPRLTPPSTPQPRPPEAEANLEVPEPTIPAGEGAARLPEPQAPLMFSDLPEGHWAKGFIDGLTSRELASGLPDGRFEPDRPMTRAELAAQLSRAFDLPIQRSAQSFQDVPADYWATDSINEAVTTGFMQGYPNNVFQPGLTVPRVQVIVAIATGLGLQPSQPADTLLQPYEDAAAVPEWARDKLAAALESGLVVSYPATNRLNPEASATRAEVAAMLYQALAYIGAVEPVASDAVAQ